MAATSHPASTLTAVEILKAGGNAMDAAVAACAVQCVVEAGSTGIGGDCFALYAPGGRVDGLVAYNGSGRAPAGMTLEALRAAGIERLEQHSPWSVTVPGAVEAWCRLVADHGRMPMALILEPAIELARNGYVITPRVAYDLSAEVGLLSRDDAARDTFLSDGKAPRVGDMQAQPLLANTLEVIGREGPAAFYTGAIARDMVDHLRSHGGCHTMADFAATAGEYVKPMTLDYRGHMVIECPPNGQGVIALMILGILERCPMQGDPQSPDNVHRVIEATRLAYAARDAWLADPQLSAVPVERMLSSSMLDDLAVRIDLDRAITDLPSFEGPVHNDTAYISVVDRDRNAVSFINSLFDHYGSGLMASRSGVLFHNRGQSFSLKPGHPNAAAPFKRPLHTLIPGMVAQGGRITMSFGVMGGHYQAMGHAHLMSRLIDHGLDLQSAMSLPRLFPEPGTMRVETELPLRDGVGEALRARGFDITATPWPIGGSQAVQIDWDRNILMGGSDHRKDGMAQGY